MKLPLQTGHKAWEPRRGCLTLGGEQVQSAGTHWLSVGKKTSLTERSCFPLTVSITFQLQREGCRVSPAWSAFRCCACWSLWLAGPGALSLLAAVQVFLGSFVGVGCVHPAYEGTDPKTRLLGTPLQR